MAETLERRRRPAVDDLVAYLARQERRCALDARLDPHGDSSVAVTPVAVPPDRSAPVPPLPPATPVRACAGIERDRRVASGRALGTFLALLLAVVGVREVAASPGALPFALGAESGESSLVAEPLVARLPVFAAPGGDPRAARVLDHPTVSGGPLVLLVIGEADGAWLRVQLPVEPNGTTGWVRGADVEVRATPYRIRILRAAGRLELYRGRHLELQVAAAIGPHDAPPAGRYFVTDLIEPSPSRHGPYGNYVFGLSGGGDVVEGVSRGEGVIGIHGTSPFREAPEGGHGSVALTNAAMEDLVGRLPRGTPVDVVA